MIEATAADKDKHRFVEFLDFILKHGFDVQISEHFNCYNPLLEAVNKANYQAFKELIRRGAKYKLEFYRNKINLLQSAESMLNYYENITEDAQKYYPDIVKMKGKKAKTLKQRIIPYLKRLKDPKTGAPLFKE